jgi:putative ABC transport system substrate-binding protein
MEHSLSAISRARADGLLVATGAATLIHKERIVEFAAKRRLPTIYTLGRFVSAGGLMSYGANLPRLARRAATFVDKIFKGTRPADLPVEQPRKFDLIVNLKTAKTIGVTLAPQFLLQADQIIK